MNFLTGNTDAHVNTLAQTKLLQLETYLAPYHIHAAAPISVLPTNKLDTCCTKHIQDIHTSLVSSSSVIDNDNGQVHEPCPQCNTVKQCA